jgi:hypothetical protein
LMIMYAAPTTGYYQLRFVDSGADVQMVAFMSPTVVISDIETVASTCVASGDGLNRAASGVPAVFTVQANGVYHSSINSRYSDGDVFDISIATGATVLQFSQEYVGDGRYRVIYTAMSSGHAEASWDVMLSVSLAGTEIEGSPFVLQMRAGEVVAANSVAQLPGLSQLSRSRLVTQMAT